MRPTPNHKILISHCSHPFFFSEDPAQIPDQMGMVIVPNSSGCSPGCPPTRSHLCWEEPTDRAHFQPPELFPSLTECHVCLCLYIRER